MPLPDNWIQYLVQIPIVAAFMAFSGWLTKLLLDFSVTRERASLELFKEQRQIDRDYGLRLAESTDKTVATLTERLTASVAALGTNVDRSLANAREQDKALFERLQAVVLAMEETSRGVATQVREMNGQMAVLARSLESATSILQHEINNRSKRMGAKK